MRYGTTVALAQHHGGGAVVVTALLSMDARTVYHFGDDVNEGEGGVEGLKGTMKLGTFC